MVSGEKNPQELDKLSLVPKSILQKEAGDGNQTFSLSCQPAIVRLGTHPGLLSLEPSVCSAVTSEQRVCTISCWLQGALRACLVSAG